MGIRDVLDKIGQPKPHEAPVESSSGGTSRASTALGDPGTLQELSTQSPPSVNSGSTLPWPSAIPDLGALQIGPFEPCAVCGVGSWARYRDAVLCLRCATAPETPLRLTYRNVLRRWWTLSAEADEVGREEEQILKRLEEVGDPQTTGLRRRWAREWLEETGVCPLCGKSGPDHECICLEDK